MRTLTAKRPASVGAYVLVAAGLAWLALVILLPLSAVFIQSLEKGAQAALNALKEPDALSAVRLTLLVAGICVPLNAVFGLAAAWSVVFFEFKGKGLLLSHARAMGEFGAVSVASGHIRGLTNTLPLHVEVLYNEYDFVGAFATASLLAGLALITLILKTGLEWRYAGELS